MKEKKHQPGRRRFVKCLAAGAMGFMSGFPPVLFPAQPPAVTAGKGNMRYRRLGRTGLQISEISLGGSPLPDWNLFVEIIKRGVNYIDTSHSYLNGNSERQIGQLFKEIGREEAYVCTKFHLRESFSEASIIKSVEESLRRLGIDTIDVLAVHGAEDAAQLTDERVLGAFAKLGKAGKYRFRGLSCHANHHQVIKNAVESGHYDMVQMGYNVFDIDEGQSDVTTYEDYLGRSGISGLIALARSRDVGVIAMKALKVGGRRQNLEKYKTHTTSIYQAMLKWVLENRDVASVVTEILNYDQMREDLGVLGSPLSAAERHNLYRHVSENRRDYCHMCGSCQAACPAGIRLTDIMRCLTYEENYGKAALARSIYARVAAERMPSSCRDCRACEIACPYGVSVRQKIGEARRSFA